MTHNREANISPQEGGKVIRDVPISGFSWNHGLFYFLLKVPSISHMIIQEYHINSKLKVGQNIQLGITVY